MISAGSLLPDVMDVQDGILIRGVVRKNSKGVTASMEKTMEKIVALCNNRGFIYPGSQIYGGLANTWDYGNLGVELKNNVKKAWWQKFVTETPENVGVDCAIAILMNPRTWIASGHLASFSDPLMDCKACGARFRADQLIESYAAEKEMTLDGSVDGWTADEMMSFINKFSVPCPTCGKFHWTDIRQFNLMFKTFQGVTEDSTATVYLRPETAQGIFVNFKNVQRTSRKKIPFGICQIGKSFRNEITPGNFTFRTREFEQMELEFFCEPDTDLEWFKYWKDFCWNWLMTLGLKPEETRMRDHDPEELSFYSKATTDIEFLFPFGWGELWGIAEPISTIRRRPATSLTLSSLHWALTVSLWLSCVQLMTRKSSRAATSVLLCTSIRHWHPSRSASCLCPRSSATKLLRSTKSSASATTASSTTAAISASAIADRMRSVLLSA